jgi:hypothetical protein
MRWRAILRPVSSTIRVGGESLRMHDDDHKGRIDLETADPADSRKTRASNERVFLGARASGIIRRLAARRNRSRTPGPWRGRLRWFLRGVDLPLVLASFAAIE